MAERLLRNIIEFTSDFRLIDDELAATLEDNAVSRGKLTIRQQDLVSNSKITTWDNELNSVADH